VDTAAMPPLLNTDVGKNKRMENKWTHEEKWRRKLEREKRSQIIFQKCIYFV
jgi:hypothetical protein